MSLPSLVLAFGTSIAPAAPADVAEEEPGPTAEDVILEAGSLRYRWDKAWPQLPEGLGMGNTHGCMVVDDVDRIYVNTDSENAVMIFQPDGKYLGGWGKEFAGGAHGMAITREGNNQFLYLTHLGRHELVKTTLEGQVLWAVGYPQESGVYQKAGQYRPTAVAVGPDGDVYVADGYGTSWIHQYDWKGDYQRSFAGPGTEPGKCRTCHGLWMDHRGEEGPTLLVADRENNRLQRFGLEGQHLGVIEGFLRRPCSFYEHEGIVVIADLAGRVTLLDEKDQLIGHLGDNPDPAKRAQNGVPPEQWADGEFLSPHSACFDKSGNLYVMDWNRLGRVTKLERLR